MPVQLEKLHISANNATQVGYWGLYQDPGNWILCYKIIEKQKTSREPGAGMQKSGRFENWSRFRMGILFTGVDVFRDVGQGRKDAVRWFGVEG